MERYYVIADDYIMLFNNEKDSIAAAMNLLEDNNIKYIEYGVENYDNWKGMIPTVVLRSGE